MEDEIKESAMLFTAAEVEARLTAARAEWEASAKGASDAAVEEASKAAFENGRERAASEAAGRIAELETSLNAAKITASRRETELRCARLLRAAELDEAMTEFLLSPGETDVTDEILAARVTALSDAVEAAAVRELRARASGVIPGSGDAVPISGKLIRDTPIAQLARIMS